MYKLDLHTHSIASPDGSLRARDYRAMLASGHLDLIAVTDHDTIAFAQELQQELGPRIIIGEEISSLDGEIIGLYLKEAIPAGLSAKDTIKKIRDQKGLVYIPHPFENLRSALSPATLAQVADDVDIIETFNGRAFLDNKSQPAKRWAEAQAVAAAASSDAHGRLGWGKTYSLTQQLPTRESLVKLLQAAQHSERRVGLAGLCYPKFNRLRKVFGHDK